MMRRTAVTPAELRSALTDLAIRAAAFARRRGLDEQRELLVAAISNANQTLSAADAPAEIADAEALVAAYIAAGGDWHALVGAVNRHALDGSKRRAS